MGTIQVTMTICDNPLCYTRQEIGPGEVGRGYRIDKLTYDGGVVKNIYACSPGCLEPAVEYMIEASRA